MHAQTLMDDLTGRVIRLDAGYKVSKLILN